MASRRYYNETKEETTMEITNFVQKPTIVFGNDIGKCSDSELLVLITKSKEKIEELESLRLDSQKVENTCTELEYAIIEMVELLDKDIAS